MAIDKKIIKENAIRFGILKEGVKCLECGSENDYGKEKCQCGASLAGDQDREHEKEEDSKKKQEKMTRKSPVASVSDGKNKG